MHLSCSQINRIVRCRRHQMGFICTGKQRRFKLCIPVVTVIRPMISIIFCLRVYLIANELVHKFGTSFITKSKTVYKRVLHFPIDMLLYWNHWSDFPLLTFRFKRVLSSNHVCIWLRSGDIILFTRRTSNYLWPDQHFLH